MDSYEDLVKMWESVSLYENVCLKCSVCNSKCKIAENKWLCRIENIYQFPAAIELLTNDEDNYVVYDNTWVILCSRKCHILYKRYTEEYDIFEKNVNDDEKKYIIYHKCNIVELRYATLDTKRIVSLINIKCCLSRVDG